MDAFAHLLRSVITRVAQPPLNELSKQPGIQAVYRVVAHDPNGHCADAITTLRYVRPTAHVSAHYLGVFDDKPIQRVMTEADYRAFHVKLTQLGLDKLADQPNMPVFNARILLLERAAGTFTTDVILALNATESPYHDLVKLITTYLPEAVREVT